MTASAQRLHRRGCPFSGSAELVDAVDNDGRPYRGYACHRIMPLAEIEVLEAAGREKERNDG